MANENYINHIALVLDASSSMSSLRTELVRVADSQIAYLAQRSQELDQETRVTVYTFADSVQCVFYDKDVLRLPSISKHYRPNGMTALIDATIKSQQDLALTPEIYGDHAFLTYVLTDGQENRSRNSAFELERMLDKLADHWTVAVLVPDQRGKFEAKKFGFPADNIAIWDTTSTQGLNEAGNKIREATDAFMTSRASGVRGSRSIFSTAPEALNKQTVQAAKLTALNPGAYVIFDVMASGPIREYIESRGMHYKIGGAFYQLMKTESIQAGKTIAVMEKSTSKVYMGPQARSILGLPDMDVRVAPQFNPDYEVFVQSTSVNRKLIAGTKLLVVS